MRGYFAIGVEGVSKPMNLGSLFRSAHAFGASFVFTIAATYSAAESGKSDTSDTPGQIPFYKFPDIPSILLPKRCKLVGVELTDKAIELPSFHHPSQAGYVLGPERGSLSQEITERCEFVIRIPTAFCVNVAIAGAIVMYDRIISLGRFQRRSERPGGPIDPLPNHVFGDPKIQNQMEKFRDTVPLLSALEDP